MRMQGLARWILMLITALPLPVQASISLGVPSDACSRAPAATSPELCRAHPSLHAKTTEPALRGEAAARRRLRLGLERASAPDTAGNLRRDPLVNPELSPRYLPLDPVPVLSLQF
jgi:hypothetical protein